MSLISRLLLLSLVLFTGAAFAATSSLEGTVKDANGQVVKNADVKIEPRTGGPAKVVKTDAKGHYVYSGLDTGREYRVTLLVGGVVKASINNVKTKPSSPTQLLNFDLKKESAGPKTAPGKKKTHMVYVPAQTGSNMGGRWVEVEEGSEVLTPGVGRVYQVSGESLRKGK